MLKALIENSDGHLALEWPVPDQLARRTLPDECVIRITLRDVLALRLVSRETRDCVNKFFVGSFKPSTLGLLENPLFHIIDRCKTLITQRGKIYIERVSHILILEQCHVPFEKIECIEANAAFIVETLRVYGKIPINTWGRNTNLTKELRALLENVPREMWPVEELNKCWGDCVPIVDEFLGEDYKPCPVNVENAYSVENFRILRARTPHTWSPTKLAINSVKHRLPPLWWLDEVEGVDRNDTRIVAAARLICVLRTLKEKGFADNGIFPEDILHEEPFKVVRVARKYGMKITNKHLIYDTLDFDKTKSIKALYDANYFKGPVKVFWIASRTFNHLRSLKALLAMGLSRSEIAKPFLLGFMNNTCKKHSLATVAAEFPSLSIGLAQRLIGLCKRTEDALYLISNWCSPLQLPIFLSDMKECIYENTGYCTDESRDEIDELLDAASNVLMKSPRYRTRVAENIIKRFEEHTSEAKREFSRRLF
jgi:hypothetical protein